MTYRVIVVSRQKRMLENFASLGDCVLRAWQLLNDGDTGTFPLQIEHHPGAVFWFGDKKDEEASRLSLKDVAQKHGVELPEIVPPPAIA